VDEGAVRAAATELADAQAAAALLHARVRQEIWNTLTPEQQARAGELRAQREQRRQQRLEQRRQRLEERLKPPRQGQAQL
jgi:Spy/CpxP family protein refolding chaperone